MGQQFELKPYIDAVLDGGSSVNSQARRANIDPTALRRLLIKDPRYGAAKAAGVVASRDKRSAAELQKTPLAVDVVENKMPLSEAAAKHGISEITVRNRIKKAFPNYFRPYRRAGADINDTDKITTANKALQAGPNVSSSCPLITWETAASLGETLDELSLVDVEAWFPAAREHSPNSVCLRIQDNGMTAPHGALRTFPTGSVIFVDRSLIEPAEGDRVVAKLTRMDKLVFRLYHEGDGQFSMPWLEPLNAMYEPIRIPFTIFGKVFGKWEDV